jgi:hypothetical protein
VSSVGLLEVVCHGVNCICISCEDYVFSIRCL